MPHGIIQYVYFNELFVANGQMAAPGASSATSSSSPDTVPSDMGAQFMMASSAASSLVPNMQAIIARAQAAQQSHHHSNSVPNSLTGEHVPVRSDSPFSGQSDTSDESPSQAAAPHTAPSLDSSIDRRDVEMTQVAAS